MAISAAADPAPSGLHDTAVAETEALLATVAAPSGGQAPRLVSSGEGDADAASAAAGRWPVPLLAAAAVGATVAAAAAYARDRSGGRGTSSLDPGHALAAFASERLLRVNGSMLPAQDELTGDYRALDGRWVRVHANFAHHRAAALRALQLPQGASAQALRSAVAARAAAVAEREVIAAGGCAAMLRTRAEWLGMAQSAALADTPLLDVRPLGPHRPAWPTGEPSGATPLAGVRVLDLTRVIAGPVAARILASLGATVVRISARGLEQVPHLWVDTGFGKVSADADITSQAGARALYQLAATADVVVQGYRPGALARRGLGSAELVHANRGVVYAELSAWSSTGPWAPRRGFDSLVQMATGLACPEDGPAGAAPEPLPVQALDHATGWLLAFGVVRALHRRAVDGGGWHVQASLARTAQWLTELPRAVARTGLLSVAYGAQTSSAFGTLTYVVPPGTVGDCPLRYPGPPTKAGTHPAAWPDPAR